MSEENKSSKAAVILAFIFFACVCFYALKNRSLLLEPAKQLLASLNFKNFVAEVQTAYTSDALVEKDFLLSLNGLYARLSNRRLYNNVVLLNNGYLTLQADRADQTEKAEAVSSFSHYLMDVHQTPFLYVQSGRGVDLAGDLLPTGIHNADAANMGQLVSLLEERQVNCLYLAPLMNSTINQVEANYFRTDHHWNYQGAFLAFGQIAREIDQLLPEELDLTYAQPDMWETHTLKDHFLGSNGKRVGPWYTGVDDMVYYTPRFGTEISCTVHKYNAVYKGAFEDANMRPSHLTRRNYFDTNPYCLYIGGDYPLVSHRNYCAPNDQKLLMVKDSFTLPVQAFMSTLFSEVDVIDPRHYTEQTLAEFIQCRDYDLVMLLQNASTLSISSYNEILKTPKAQPRQIIDSQSIPEIDIPAAEGNEHYAVIADNMQPGSLYALEIDYAEMYEGAPHGFTAALHDGNLGTDLAVFSFDMDYGNQTDGFAWSIAVPEDAAHSLQLICYAGLKGQTDQHALLLGGVTLTQIR